MINRIIHWLWKLTRLDIECEYYCGSCPFYESCCQGEAVELSTIHYQKAA